MFIQRITKEEINELPIVRFGGKIIVVDDVLKVEEAMKDLCKQKIVGIDTETKPSFQKGQKHKVSLIQISTLENCYLFRLNMIQMPEKLTQFLANTKIKKVGLALRDDFSGLYKHHRFKPANVIDIQSIVKNYGIFELSLQKIFAIVFQQKISKAQQLSNWEAGELTESQQLYAATDAWACLKIYLRLMEETPLTKHELEQLIKQETAV